MLMIDGFTFYRNGARPNRANFDFEISLYVCSSKSKLACKAYADVNSDNYIVRINNKHNHPPPKYKVQRDGTYVKDCNCGAV